MPVNANLLMNKYKISEGKLLGQKLKMIEEKWVNLESGGLSLNSALSRWIDCNCHRRILNMVDTLL